MGLTTRLAGALGLLAVAGCEGADLRIPLPSVESLSKLVVLKEKAPDWQSPQLQKHPLVGRIWRPADGRFVTRQTLMAELVGSTFILLGEKHDNPDHHLLQAELIRGLTEQGRRPAVVWEMIPETKQPILDRAYRTFSRDAAGLGAALAWDVSGWPAWRLYQPIADAAMAKNLPMYGAGLPRSVVRALARSKPSLAFTKRRRGLGLDIPMDEKLRARAIEQLFLGHCELMPRTALGPLFTVQRARDAVFAEHMLAAGVKDGAILISGTGHVRKDLATPLFLYRYQPGVRVTTVGFVEVRDGTLDPVDYAEQFSAPVLPFDYVWFTPRAETKDYCAGLRKKWAKPKQAKSPEKAAKPAAKMTPASALEKPAVGKKNIAAPGSNPPETGRGMVGAANVANAGKAGMATAKTGAAMPGEATTAKAETAKAMADGSEGLPPVPRIKPPRPSPSGAAKP